MLMVCGKGKRITEVHYDFSAEKVHTTTENNYFGRVATWFVTDDISSWRNRYSLKEAEDFAWIEAVEANEDELMWIRDHFKNLPITNNTRVVWFGELARFIVANL